MPIYHSDSACPVDVSPKDPDAVLDYRFDWKANGYLEAGETIDSYTITAPVGITVDSHSQAAGVVRVWLSGGTAGQQYAIACRITTSGGRIDERTMRLPVRQR